MADENLFGKLLELFNQPGPINWRFAEEVMGQLVGPTEPIDPWLAEEYQEVTRVAQLRITTASSLNFSGGLDSTQLDRTGWARETIHGLQGLLDPFAARLDQPRPSGPLGEMLAPLGPALLGLQLGLMVGTLGGRVMGQFDVGFPTWRNGSLLLVLPNIEAFATNADLDPKQVRLWAAFREVTHDGEFSISWVRSRFSELLESFFATLELNGQALGEQLELLQDPSQLQRLLEDPSEMSALIATDDQKPVVEEIQAFMATLEGYADWATAKAAGSFLPDLGAIRSALATRRQNPTEGDQLQRNLLGMDRTTDLAGLGHDFCDELARRWGEETPERLWRNPEQLPTLAELSDPVGWAARVLLD